MKYVSVAIVIIVLVTLVSASIKNKNKVSDVINTEESKQETDTKVNNTKNIMDKQGVKIEITKEGQGAEIKSDQIAVVNYTGKFTDGKVFDSSIPRGTPFEFPLGAGRVIKGWEIGVEGMKVGEKRTLTIPSDLAYGPNGYGPIPGGAMLVFEVELLGIK